MSESAGEIPKRTKNIQEKKMGKNEHKKTKKQTHKQTNKKDACSVASCVVSISLLKKAGAATTTENDTWRQVVLRLLR